MIMTYSSMPSAIAAAAFQRFSPSKTLFLSLEVPLEELKRRQSKYLAYHKVEKPPMPSKLFKAIKTANAANW